MTTETTYTKSDLPDWKLDEPVRIWKQNGYWCVVAQHPRDGALNGYVAVGESHPFYGQDYELVPVEVHGYLTYGSGPWFGFDTLHSGDFDTLDRDGRITGYRWTEDAVAAEVSSLADQLHRLDGC